MSTTTSRWARPSSSNVPLPAQIQVKVSSEAAGSITMTPVIVQTMPVRDLVEVIVATTGKNADRVAEVLSRGAVVQGASRFRWEPLTPDASALARILSGFPDPDPSRAFRPEACVAVRLVAGRHVLELPKETAAARRFLRRRSFWDAVMRVARTPEYIDYSYRLRCDEYRTALTADESAGLIAAAELLRYPGVARQVRSVGAERVEYLVRFP